MRCLYVRACVLACVCSSIWMNRVGVDAPRIKEAFKYQYAHCIQWNCKIFYKFYELLICRLCVCVFFFFTRNPSIPMSMYVYAVYSFSRRTLFSYTYLYVTHVSYEIHMEKILRRASCLSHIIYYSLDDLCIDWEHNFAFQKKKKRKTNGVSTTMMMTTTTGKSAATASVHIKYRNRVFVYI